MAKRRNRSIQSSNDPFGLDCEEIDPNGDVDFDAGLPNRVGEPTQKRHTGVTDRVRKSEDIPAGQRYKDEINFEDGFPDRTSDLPRVQVAKKSMDFPSVSEIIKIAKQEGTEVQTLIFDKEKFDKAKALSWAKEHDFKADKVDETESSFRLRQKAPAAFDEKSFRTIKISEGVKAVVGKPKAAKQESAKSDDSGNELRSEQLKNTTAEVPDVLTWEAVRKRRLPKDEEGNPQSGLPESLEADVPPKYRYWKCENIEDALRVREALVEAQLFNSETVRKVDGKLRRTVVENVVKLYLPPQYDEEERPSIPPKVRPVDKAANLIGDSENETILFDQAVTKTVGIEAIMDRVTKLDSDWIVCCEDNNENRSSMGLRLFRLKSRDDLIFATNKKIPDNDLIEWIETTSPEDQVVKEAFADGRKIPLLKTQEERVVFGVVMEPDEIDSQGDVVSADAIEKAAHCFMEKFGNLGLQHQEIVNGKLVLLETFISPTDFEVDGQNVKKGSWLMKERVVDDELWKAVKKGEITGYSIGGSAIRKPRN